MGMGVETPETFRERVLARDGNRCTVARLLGGHCSSTLHAHHIVPRSEGGDNSTDNGGTVCSRHHPQWEALRRQIVRYRGGSGRRCNRPHRSAEARALCERRLNREAA